MTYLLTIVIILYLSESQHILAYVAQGDRAAFRQLYELYSAKVYNTALSYAQSEVDAEEITQQVFTKVYRSAHSFKGDAAVGTWVYRITINTSLNYLKSRRRRAYVQLDSVPEESAGLDHPGIDMERREDAQILFTVIDTLAESQKTAFILSYIEELPRQEVADVMDTSLKAVESLLMRAKANLRKKLADRYPNRKK